MKKLLLLVAIAAALGSTSCKKDYDCTCTILGTTTVSQIKDVKKSDAEDACNALNTAASVGGGSCSLD